MIINVHAGHNPDGKTACGAVGFVKESTEARAIAGLLERRLRMAGHEVFDCTVDNGTSQSDVLKKIVAKCNAHTASLDVSLHLNAGAGDSAGNGKTAGVEVYIYNSSSKAKPYAEAVLKEIAALGFTNRGVKERATLSVLKNTKAPAMLVECFFVDDKDDVELYRRLGGGDAIAAAIESGIIAIAGTCGAAVAAVPSAAPAQAEQEVYGIVTGNGVRIRTGPGTNYSAVDSVNTGQRVRIWKNEEGWYMIDNNKWISAKYVRRE